MTRSLLGFLIWCVATPLLANEIVAARTIRFQAVIGHDDIMVRRGAKTQGELDAQDIVGMEARVMLYAGQTIHPQDIAPPAVVERNQIVNLVFERGGLVISTEARALSRGAVGDLVRVMNLTSRATVSGVIQENGTVAVGVSPIRRKN